LLIFSPFFHTKQKQMKMKMVANNLKSYDICIIGSGPAGLACLSAIREPYSLDILNDEQINTANRFLKRNQNKQDEQQSTNQPSVCIIDPHSSWMQKWKDSFQKLDIKYLRSPVLAHVNLFDTNALLAYAVEQGRESELYESGLFDRKELLPLGQSQIGLWKLPSTKLFNDFCDNMSQSLNHDYIQGAAMKVEACRNGLRQLELTVHLKDDNEHQIVLTDHVIVAMGPIGKPIVPNWLIKTNKKLQDAERPTTRICQWTQMDQIMSRAPKRVLVLGGGLTAVQVAQRCCTMNNAANSKVVLCSRRPLTCRHFDIPIAWFDRRSTNKCMYDFYHLPVGDRLALLKQTRGGGSVPPVYMKDLHRLEMLGKLQRVVGTPKILSDGDTDKPIQVMLGEEMVEFDQIILACGYKPNCQAHPLIQSIKELNPELEFMGGFPMVTEDLQIAKDIFVTGALGSLNTGPDAANLMGIRRASQIVANSLECSVSTSRMRNEGKVFENRFDAFWSSDSDDSDDSDEDES
jgi:lysine/ornithine N-monooxygenase